jgi:hypothetical protein
MVKINHKRGDWLVWENQLSDADGPKSIAGWTIRSQVRDGSTLISLLTTTIIDASIGKYQLKDETTSTWPVKVLQCDIEYTMPSGQVFSTETFEIDCKQDVTLPS